MDDTKALREGILTMRETPESCRCERRASTDPKNEVRTYYLPVFFSSIMFKRVFRKNILARRIMELHNNLDDLYELCTDVYHSAAGLWASSLPSFDERLGIFSTRARKVEGFSTPPILLGVALPRFRCALSSCPCGERRSV